MCKIPVLRKLCRYVHKNEYTYVNQWLWGWGFHDDVADLFDWPKVETEESVFLKGLRETYDRLILNKVLIVLDRFNLHYYVGHIKPENFDKLSAKLRKQKIVKSGQAVDWPELLSEMKLMLRQPGDSDYIRYWWGTDNQSAPSVYAQQSESMRSRRMSPGLKLRFSLLPKCKGSVPWTSEYFKLDYATMINNMGGSPAAYVKRLWVAPGTNQYIPDKGDQNACVMCNMNFRVRVYATFTFSGLNPNLHQ